MRGSRVVCIIIGRRLRDRYTEPLGGLGLAQCGVEALRGRNPVEKGEGKQSGGGSSAAEPLSLAATSSVTPREGVARSDLNNRLRRRTFSTDHLAVVVAFIVVIVEKAVSLL